MLDSLLACLEIGLVGFLARLEPRNMLGIWDGLGGRAVLAVANAGRTTIAGHLSGLLRRRRGWRHLDDIGKCARGKVLLVTVTVPTPLAMVLLTLFGKGSPERRKSIRIIRRGHRLCCLLLLMATSRPGSRPVVSVAMVSFKPRGRRNTEGWIVASGRKDRQLLRSAGLQRWEAAVVLQINRGVLGRRCIRPIDMKPVGQVCRVVREDTSAPSETVPCHPVSKVVSVFHDRQFSNSTLETYLQM